MKLMNAEASELANKIEAEANEINLAAEAILFQYDTEEIIQPGDMSILRLAGIADRDKLQSERARITRVQRNLEAAGTHSQFEQAKDRLKLATELHDEQRPVLEQKLSDLQRELQKLDREKKRAEDWVDGYKQARQRLADVQHLPEFVRAQYQQSKMLAEDGIKRQILDRESRLQMIAGVLETDHGSREAISHAQSFAKHLLPGDGLGNSSISYDAWNDYKQQLDAERLVLEQEQADLKTQLDERMADALRLTRFYLDQIPD